MNRLRQGKLMLREKLEEKIKRANAGESGQDVGIADNH